MLFAGVTILHPPPTEPMDSPLTPTDGNSTQGETQLPPASGNNIATIAGGTAAVAVLVGILVLLVFVGVMLLRYGDCCCVNVQIGQLLF